MALVGIVATRKLERIPTSRLQVGAELLLDTLIGFFGDVMGSEEKAKRYLPLLGTFSFYINVQLLWFNSRSRVSAWNANSD